MSLQTEFTLNIDEDNLYLIPNHEYINDNNERIIAVGYGNKINLDKLEHEYKYILDSFNLKTVLKWNEFTVIELGLRIYYIYKHTTNIIKRELVKYNEKIENLIDFYVKKRNFFYDKYFNTIDVKYKFHCPDTNKFILNVVPRLERYSNYSEEAFNLPIVKTIFKLRSVQREIEDLFNLYYETVNDKINYYDTVCYQLDFNINQYKHYSYTAAFVIVYDYYKNMLTGYNRDKQKLVSEYGELFDCEFII